MLNLSTTKTMKKILLGLASVGMAVSAFAEGTSTAAAYAGSTAESIVTGVSGTMTNFLTGAAPVVVTIVVAGLSIWAGLALIGILKKSFSAGKGR